MAINTKLSLPPFPSQIRSSKTVATVGPDGRLDIKSANKPDRLNSRRLDDSGSRGSSSKGSSIKISSKLPRDSRNSAEKPAIKQSPVAPVEPAADAGPAEILQGLMNKFIFLKENGGKAEAFKALQKSFAANAAVLSPYFIPLKDLMNLIMELETFIGRSGEHVGKTPEQVLRGFLGTNMIGDSKLAARYPSDDDKPIDKVV